MLRPNLVHCGSRSTPWRRMEISVFRDGCRMQSVRLWMTKGRGANASGWSLKIGFMLAMLVKFQ